MNTLELLSPELPAFHLHLYRSEALLRKFVTAYNADKPLRKRLRPNHIALMYELLEIYQDVLERDLSNGKLSRPGAPLPYISTNNVQLAKSLLCRARTIQNLRHRLKEAGLITEETWHGSKANYKLRLNHKVLFLASRPEAENDWQTFLEELPKE